VHNWRIDKSLSRNFLDFYDQVRDAPGGGVEVLVDAGEVDGAGVTVRAERWEKPPQVDRDGVLVELLSKDPDWASDSDADSAAAARLFPPPSQRQKLETAIAAAGIQRPSGSARRRRSRQAEDEDD